MYESKTDMFKTKSLLLSTNVWTGLIDTTCRFQNDNIRVCTGRKPHDVLMSVIRRTEVPKTSL